jgi:hypothetical protein
VTNFGYLNDFTDHLKMKPDGTFYELKSGYSEHDKKIRRLPDRQRAPTDTVLISTMEGESNVKYEKPVAWVFRDHIYGSSWLLRVPFYLSRN